MEVGGEGVEGGGQEGLMKGFEGGTWQGKKGKEKGKRRRRGKRKETNFEGEGEGEGRERKI